MKRNSATVACSVPTTTVSSSLASHEGESSSTTSLGSCIFKQISFESTSSFATTVPSAVSFATPSSLSLRVQPPDTSAFVPAPRGTIPLSESSINIPVSADEVFQRAISTNLATTSSPVCQGAPSDSRCELFSSASSSSILTAPHSADEVDEEPIVLREFTAACSVSIIVPDTSPSAHQCKVYETSDASSVEVSYQSVPSESSAGHNSFHKSTFHVSDEESLPTKAISGIDQQTACPASQRPDDTKAADNDPVTTATLWQAAQGLSWTDCFSSDSSSSDLCNLMSNQDTAADTVAVSGVEHLSTPGPSSNGTDGAQAADAHPVSAATLWDDARALSWTDCFNSDSASSSLCNLVSNDNASSDSMAMEPELPSTASFDDILVSPDIFFPLCTFYSGHRTLPSIGIAGTLLMLGHFRYPDEEVNAECPSAPSTSSPSVSPTPTSAITEQDPNETFDRQELGESADYTVPERDSGLDMALFDIAEEDEPEQSFHEDLDDIELLQDYENHVQHATLTSRNAFVAHVVENATPPSLWRRNVRTGIVSDGIQSFPTINEEDEGSTASVVPESASHISLLTADSDQFDYAQVRNSRSSFT